MTLLVVGGSGHLGAELCRQALAAGTRVVGTYASAPGTVPGVDWERLDIRDPSAVTKLFEAIRPSTVVNTAYDYLDWRVNANGAAHVAAASAGVGARLVHISSDALHSGRPEPYGDDEPPSPVTAYGAGKAAAETAVRVLDPGAAIVRTSLIIGDRDSKQVRLCVDLITGAMAGALFSDEYRCPVEVGDLAAATLELAGGSYAGLINVAGSDAVSRAELGELVAGWYGLDATAMPVRTLAEAGLVRPAEVRLDIARARSILRTPLRGVYELTPAAGRT